MFGIDAKEIFQQKISNLIVALFAIHIIVVTFTYIIKWVHPYFKSRTAECNREKQKYSPGCTSFFGINCPHASEKKISVCNECKGEITDDQFITILGNLKTLVDITDSPSNTLLDPASLMKINMMCDSKFEDASGRGSCFRYNLNKRKCSSEAQTNITINPATEVDYSCPELVLSDLVTERIIEQSDSSDSFLSASCKESTSDFKKELEQIIIEFERSGDGQKQKIDEDLTIIKLQNYLKTSLMKSDVAGSFGRNGKQVSKENKLLEVAITEFEKELKPIKDQIKILKECISGFDNNCNTQNSIPSDFSSSVSGSGVLSESYSGTLSTTCSTDLQSYISSSYQILSEKHIGPLETQSRYKSIKKLDQIASVHQCKNKHKNNCYTNNKQSQIANKKSPKKQDSKKSPDSRKSAQRSPIAEMYIKLSQCNSQLICLAKNKAEKLSCSDNTVTYRIDLNVNLGGRPVSNSKKSMSIERGIPPLTSEPEDILGKLADTHIHLRPPPK